MLFLGSTASFTLKQCLSQVSIVICDRSTAGVILTKVYPNLWVNNFNLFFMKYLKENVVICPIDCSVCYLSIYHRMKFVWTILSVTVSEQLPISSQMLQGLEIECNASRKCVFMHQKSDLRNN